jgi:hypothetical protein
MDGPRRDGTSPETEGDASTGGATASRGSREILGFSRIPRREGDSFVGRSAVEDAAREGHPCYIARIPSGTPPPAYEQAPL